MQDKGVHITNMRQKIFTKPELHRFLNLCGLSDLTIEQYITLMNNIDEFVSVLVEYRLDEAMQDRETELKEEYEADLQDYNTCVIDKMNAIIEDELQSELEQLKKTNAELLSDCEDMASHIYVSDLCDEHGLSKRDREIVLEFFHGTNCKQMIDMVFELIANE
jgi:predicted RNase H-like nuclease (RuvC/YqgF family)